MIRKASQNDVPSMAAMWYLMVREMMNGSDGEPIGSWWFVATMNLMRGGMYSAWVADVDGDAVGFIDYEIKINFEDKHSWAELRTFYVKPAYRNTKVAYYLWSSFLHEVKETGAKYAEVSCEEKMQQFWGKRGFDPVPRMRKDLTAE
jgi:GNAT superfamily N-acetyltransferase